MNEFVNRNFYLFSITGLGLGIFLVIWGGRNNHIQSSLYIIGTLSTIVIMYYIEFELLISELNDIKISIVTVISIGIGLQASFYLTKWANSIFILLGAILGYCIGTFFFSILVDYIGSDPRVI